MTQEVIPATPLETYTDADLLAEVKRRGYEVHKWPKDPPFEDNGEWDEMPAYWSQ